MAESSARKAHRRAYREANRDKLNAYSREYHRARRAIDNENHRAWVERNREHVREYGRKWAAAHRDRIKAKNSRRYAASRGAEGKVTAEEWAAILFCHNGRCAHCGSSQRITIDHIVPVSKGGQHCPQNLQPLCLSCNARKKDRTSHAPIGASNSG